MRRSIRRSMRRSKRPSKMRSKMRSRVKRLKRSIKRSSKKNPVKDLVETLTLPITEEVFEPVKSKKKSKKKKKSKTWSAKLHGKGTKGKKGKKSHKKKHKKKKMKGGVDSGNPTEGLSTDQIISRNKNQFYINPIHGDGGEEIPIEFSRFTTYNTLSLPSGHQEHYLCLGDTDGSLMFDFTGAPPGHDPRTRSAHGVPTTLKWRNEYDHLGKPTGKLRIIEGNTYIEYLQNSNTVPITRTNIPGSNIGQMGGGLDNEALIKCMNRPGKPKTKEKAAACRKEQEEIREALETGGI